MAAVGESSSSSNWTDPYKEFELYLEKANEEIGAVFHQIEISSRAARVVVAKTPNTPPPVPVRRHYHQQQEQRGEEPIGRSRRAGLRVTQDYFIGDLPLPPPPLSVRNPHSRSYRHRQQLNGGHVYQRRTSCPGFQSGLSASSVLSSGHDVDGTDGVDGVDLMSLAASESGNASAQSHRYISQSQKKKSTAAAAATASDNRRRSGRPLRRHLTADSALLQLTDNGRIDRFNQQSPYHPQAIQVWTSSLMAEFNHIIDGELQRLARPASSSAIVTATAAGTATAKPLSPWAQIQLAAIDPVDDKSSDVIQQLSADIELVERQIFHDLNDLNSSSSASSTMHLTMTSDDPTPPQLSSPPLLRPQELKDFLQRVEDSIRTSNTTLDASSSSRDEQRLLVQVDPSNSIRFVKDLQQEPAAIESSVSAALPDAKEEAEVPLGRPETPTFDAGTQTSPMSLSRSSSFLWVSDCNCSGSLDGMAVVSSSAPTSRHSEAGSLTSGVSRIVHMDTSMSSLVSESLSTNGLMIRRPTPDSANDEDEDGTSSSEVSSISPSIEQQHSHHGAESGIGTGSPPPRDRRRRPVDHRHPEVSVQTGRDTPEESDDVDSSGSTSSSSSTGTSLSSDGRHRTNKESKKRDKVRRRETWEKIRRRHSCKRVPSRRRDKAEVVWIRQTPPPAPLPPSPVVAEASPESTVTKILHKPPVVIVHQSAAPSVSRPKPRPFNLLKNEPSQHPPSMNFPPSTSKSSSNPFLVVNPMGHRHLKPISASSTPTEPYMTLETGLIAARSHSESAFAELEATEACRWLRATGFPQYAQMYEDWQFPLDLSVVERDHPFLDEDSLQALFRRLVTLNRMAKLRSEKARSRPQGGDESEDEDQECALSDQWTFQRHSRRWSRIVDLPEDPSGLLSTAAAASAALSSAMASEHVTDGRVNRSSSDVTDVTASDDTLTQERTDPANDPVILGSFRRTSSERLRHGAKSLLRRMESLRSRSRRRPVLVRPADGNLVISGPQLVDASGMESRMKELNCVDVSPADSISPTSSTPSPDLNRIVGQKTPTNQLAIQVTTPSTPLLPAAELTPSPAGSMKLKRGFFQRRSFRPSTRSGSSSTGTADDQKDAHSDSECSPTYWRRSPSSSKDINAETSPTVSTAWNSLEQSLRWKSKKSASIDTSMRSGASGFPSGSADNHNQRQKLYLNFNSATDGQATAAGIRLPGKQHSLVSSPDETDDVIHSISTPIIIRPTGYDATTPCGSLREAETRMSEGGLHNDSASTGTGTSGSHIDSDYSPAAYSASGKMHPVVVRWHSFRRSPSTSSIAYHSQQTIRMGSLTVGQFALLRKLALLRLTALLERHTSSSKPSWGWDLPKFMRKTKSPDYKDRSMFGVPLSLTVQRTGEALPKPIMAAMHYLRQSALDQVGLFRKSGVRSRIAKLKELCEVWAWQPASNMVDDDDANRSCPVDFSQHQPYDVADMIKQYFRELPEALMTNKLSETFVTIFQVVPVQQRLDALRCALLLLPDEHREALQTFLAFLTDVAALASINQMTPSNLAVCLAPSLFHLPANALYGRSAGSNGHPGSTNNPVSGSGGGGSTGSSPRRRKTVGVPDPRELSQNKAAHECLLQMINDFQHLFTVPDEIFRQCRCTYLDDSVPVTLDDLRTVEFGDWQSYMNGCMAALMKEAKDKSRGWESMSNDLRVDVAWKKVGDGHALRLWRVSTEIEAPPGELLNRVLRERHLWDTSLVKWRCVVRLDHNSDVFHYTSVSEVPAVTRDVTLLRSWRTDLPRGTCLVAQMSIDHPDAPVTSGAVRTIVLASRYLIQPCGAGKSRLVHLSRVDIMGRSPDWYNKHYGHLTALYMARIRDSFSQHLVADGPESKV